MSESENKILQEKEARTRAELERLKGQHHATIIAQVQRSTHCYIVEPYFLRHVLLYLVASQAESSRART